MGDWGRGGRFKCNQLQYNRSPKGCRMQEGDVGTKSLYIPPIRPLSGNLFLHISSSGNQAMSYRTLWQVFSVPSFMTL